MTNAWIHTTGDSYWEGCATVVSLPALPRIGETVYLSEETLQRILERSGAVLDVILADTILIRENFTVTDICYIEGEELPHLMINLTEHLRLQTKHTPADTVAALIKADFKKKGLTYKSAAERLGVSRQAISNDLSGKHPFTKKKAHKWAKTFGYRAEFLLYGKGTLY